MSSLYACIDGSDSLFCSSITCQWQSNTGGCDSGKGSSVNLNSSERLISELPRCTVWAGVNKTMYPVPVIGPGPLFQQCEEIESQPVSLLSSQGHDVKLWMCSICYHASRPITAYPAAAVQRWGARWAAAKIMYSERLIKIVWCYAIWESDQVKFHPASLAHICTLSCGACCFVCLSCHCQRGNTFIAWHELVQWW